MAAMTVATAMTAAETIPATPVERTRPTTPTRASRRRPPLAATPTAALTAPSSLGPASQRNARIQHRIQHIDDRVDDDECCDQDERDALHYRQVL